MDKDVQLALLLELRRIGDALEKQSETFRLQYELNVDTTASTNAFVNEMTPTISRLLGGTDEDE